MGFPEEKVHYIPPPIPIVERKRNIDDEINIIFIGYDFFNKGGDIALKIFKNVKNLIKNKNVKLKVISKINPLKFYNKVKDVEYLGIKENEEIREEILPKCDILLLPFRAPGLITILEAFAAGNAVLTSSHPLIDGYIKESKAGIAIKNYNIKEFSDSLIYLIENIKEMRKNAYEYIKNNYSPHIISLKLFKLYQEL